MTDRGGQAPPRPRRRREANQTEDALASAGVSARVPTLDAALRLVDGPVAALAVRAAVARALAAAAPQRPPRRRAARVAGDDGGRADEVEERVAPPVEERLRARARGVRRLAQAVVGREEPAQLVDPRRDLVRVRDEEDLCGFKSSTRLQCAHMRQF